LALDALLGLVPLLAHFFPRDLLDEMLVRAAIEAHEGTLRRKPHHGAERAVDEPAQRIVAHRHDARAGGELEILRHRQIGGAEREVALDRCAIAGALASERGKALVIVTLGGSARRGE